jgi:uncharacterized protein (TIGR02145 family)
VQRIFKRMEKKFVTVLNFLLAVILIIAGCTKEEKPPDPVADMEGNSYKTVKIGTQIWMAENLKSTKYNDGTEIALVPLAKAWNDVLTGAYCWYNNDDAQYRDVYGALYNGYTVMQGKLCPSGWHIPSREEWQLLRDFLGDTTKAGGKLKESGTDHWLSPNKGADNSTGFNALGAGIRYFEGTFSSSQSFSGIWSSTESSQSNLWSTSLYYGDASLGINLRSRKYGFSVRCLKDQK